MKHTSMADVHNLHTVQSYSFQVPQLQTVALKHADLEIKNRSVTHAYAVQAVFLAHDFQKTMEYVLCYLMRYF